MAYLEQREELERLGSQAEEASREGLEALASQDRRAQLEPLDQEATQDWKVNQIFSRFLFIHIF